MMFDAVGQETFLRTAGAIAALSMLVVLAVGYLRPSVRLWQGGKGPFPLFGTAAAAVLTAVTVIAFGYALAYKETNDVTGPTQSDRDRQAAEREGMVIPVKETPSESLKEKADRMTEKSKAENEARKKKFSELPNSEQD